MQSVFHPESYLSRQFSLKFWRFKSLVLVCAFVFYLGFFRLNFQLNSNARMDQRPRVDIWKGMARRTAFLDRPCDKAVREICQVNGDCSGITCPPPRSSE